MSVTNDENKYVKKIKYLGSKEGIIQYTTSPTFVWFAGLYITSLIMMILLNLSRVGLSWEGLTTGPQYFMRIFMYYGLNATYISNEFILNGGAWLLGPFVTVFLGLALIILSDAGFAFNSEMDDPLGTRFYAFFREDVYGYDVNIFGNKGNMFYIALVWIPIISASIMVIIAKRRLNRTSSLVTRFVVSFVIAIFIGNTFSRISDPNMHYEWSGFFHSLFVDRRQNAFVVYDGEYPPMMIATFLTLIQIFPMLVMGSIEGGISVFKLIRLRMKLRRERMLEAEERKSTLTDEEIDEEAEDLPWEVDLKQRKKAKKGGNKK
jgi:hypothetical protein